MKKLTCCHKLQLCMPRNKRQASEQRTEKTASIPRAAAAGNTFQKCAQNMPRTRKCLLWAVKMPGPSPKWPLANNCGPERRLSCQLPVGSSLYWPNAVRINLALIGFNIMLSVKTKSANANQKQQQRGQSGWESESGHGQGQGQGKVKG